MDIIATVWYPFLFVVAHVMVVFLLFWAFIILDVFFMSYFSFALAFCGSSSHPHLVALVAQVSFVSMSTLHDCLLVEVADMHISDFSSKNFLRNLWCKQA